MTAPEPPEVAAGELAAAVEYASKLQSLAAFRAEYDRRAQRIRDLEAGRDVEQQMLRNIAGQLVACQMKYDAALELVQEANNDRAKFKAECDTARADLARALPVVEAAGALVSEWEDSGLAFPRVRLAALLDALAMSIVRAAREPRTGEGG